MEVEVFAAAPLRSNQSLDGRRGGREDGKAGAVEASGGRERGQPADGSAGSAAGLLGGREEPSFFGFFPKGKADPKFFFLDS